MALSLNRAPTSGLEQASGAPPGDAHVEFGVRTEKGRVRPIAFPISFPDFGQCALVVNNGFWVHLARSECLPPGTSANVPNLTVPAYRLADDLGPRSGRCERLRWGESGPCAQAPIQRMQRDLISRDLYRERRSATVAELRAVMV